MVEIEEMEQSEIGELLSRVRYGHLGCARNNIPYVVPVHFAYCDPYLFFYTTEGKKSEIIRSNPQVCFHIEEISDDAHWKSVVVTGEAYEIESVTERESAIEHIMSVTPTLSPAVSFRWMDNSFRENREVIYKIEPRMITGRKTVKRLDENAMPSMIENERHRIY